jgi:hypothetical protein
MRFSSSPGCPDWLWGLPSLVFSGYRAVHSGGGGIKRPRRDVDHDLHLALKLGMSGAVYLLLLYAFMAWTGTSLPFLPLPAFILEILLPAFVYLYIRSWLFSPFFVLSPHFFPSFCFPSYSCLHISFFISSFFLLCRIFLRSSVSFLPAFCPSLKGT